MHAFVSAVLLRMTGPDAFDTNTQAQPPHRKLGEIEKPVGGSKRNAVIGTDGLRQTTLFEKALKGSKSGLLGVRFHGFAQQQIARGMIGDRQRVTVALVGQHELALVIGAPQIVGAQPLRKGRALGARSRSPGAAHQPMTIQDRMNRAAGRNLHRMRQAS